MSDTSAVGDVPEYTWYCPCLFPLPLKRADIKGVRACLAARAGGMQAEVRIRDVGQAAAERLPSR